MLDALGIDLKSLIFAMINFLILVGVLGKFLYKPFLGVLEKRKQAIADAFDSAAAENRKADQKMANYSRQIANVESECRDMIRDAKSKAELQAQAIIDDANNKASEIIAKAQREIQQERAQAMQEMRDEISEIAMLAASKILEEEINIGNRQYEIVDKVIEEAGKSTWQS